MTLLAIIQALIALLPQVPALYASIMQLITDGQSLLSSEDQATIDALMLKAQQNDAVATAKAEYDLTH